MTEKYKKKKRNNLFLQKPHRNVNTENIFSVNTLFGKVGLRECVL